MTPWWEGLPDRQCVECKRTLPVGGNFYAPTSQVCRGCQAERKRQIRLAHNRHLRLEAVEAYGAKCICCGEAEEAFLQFDHVEGGGKAHRQAVKGRGLHQWLKDHDWPPIVQLLCANCNAAKERPGGCPHQRGLTLCQTG